MGKTSRTKGKVYENAIAVKLKHLAIDVTAKRHLEFQGQEAVEGRDIDTTLPFAIQCKHWNATPSISAMDQITTSDKYPLRMSILKRSQKKGVKGLEVAVVDLNVMLAMLQILGWEDRIDDIRIVANDIQ
jgi:hypothetical protein